MIPYYRDNNHAHNAPENVIVIILLSYYRSQCVWWWVGGASKIKIQKFFASKIRIVFYFFLKTYAYTLLSKWVFGVSTIWKCHLLFDIPKSLRASVIGVRDAQGRPRKRMRTTRPTVPSLTTVTSNNMRMFAESFCCTDFVYEKPTRVLIQIENSARLPCINWEIITSDKSSFIVPSCKIVRRA